MCGEVSCQVVAVDGDTGPGRARAKTDRCWFVCATPRSRAIRLRVKIINLLCVSVAGLKRIKILKKVITFVQYLSVLLIRFVLLSYFKLHALELP